MCTILRTLCLNENNFNFEILTVRIQIYELAQTTLKKKKNDSICYGWKKNNFWIKFDTERLKNYETR